MNLDFNRLHRLRSRLKDGRKKRGRWILFSGGVALILLLPVYFFLLPTTSTPPSPSSTEPAEQTTQDTERHVIEGKVEEKSTLFKSMSEKKIPIQWIDLVVSKLKPYVNFKKIKGGAYRLITNVKGELVKFIFEAGPTEVYEIEKVAEGYTTQRIDVPVETVLVKVVGEIRSSLFEAMDAAGEQDLLTIAFAEILAWEVDFYKDVREGDRFKVLVEKTYKEKEFVRYGLIQAVEYQGAEKQIKGIRYQDDYYDEKGISLKKAFLKAPLRFNRISSRFSRARRHPILGGLRPHLGTDYAAPPGTPVWVVGDGVVVSCSRNGGYGNQAVVRHMNGYMTYYSHLSHYGPGIRAGVRVKQKQIVGYVGSTGLSTGPHLDYRLAKDGRFRNPLKENFPKGVPIGKGKWEPFQRVRDDMLNRLQGGAPNQPLQSPLLSQEVGERVPSGQST